MKKVVVVTAALLAAVPALAAEEKNGANGATAPYNCDFAPACEVAPGIYGNLNVPTTSKFNLSVGGFIKLDYAYNSVNFGPTAGFQTPGNIPKSSSLQGNRDQSAFSAKQSRIWFKVAGPTLLGARTSSLLEFDFAPADSNLTDKSLGNPQQNLNENPVPRLRHAYANLDWGKTQLLFGQTSDVFAPASGNTIDFRSASGFGLAGGRNPQIRLTHRVEINKENSLKLVAALQSPYQNNNFTAGNNGAAGSTKGDTWGNSVNVAGQAFFISKAFGVAPGYYGLSQNSLTAGFFGLYGRQNVQGSEKELESWGYGFYTFVPIARSSDGKSRLRTASFEGQAYYAANLAPGANATSTSFVKNDAGELQPAKAYGVFGNFILYPTQDLGISFGYGRRGAPNFSDFKNNKNFEKFNQLAFVNASYDLNAAVRVAVEYQNLKTRYGNVDAGTSESGIANTARLALYYFF